MVHKNPFSRGLIQGLFQLREIFPWLNRLDLVWIAWKSKKPSKLFVEIGRAMPWNGEKGRRGRFCWMLWLSLNPHSAVSELSEAAAPEADTCRKQFSTLPRYPGSLCVNLLFPACTVYHGINSLWPSERVHGRYRYVRGKCACPKSHKMLQLSAG